MRMDDRNNRLQAVRRSAGFTSPTDAARHYGWPVSTYLSHENGNRGFNFDAAQKYAAKYGCDPIWLYSGKGEPPETAGFSTGTQKKQKITQGSAEYAGLIPTPKSEIPVYGYVSGSGNMTARIDDAHIVEHRPRPPMLDGVKEAFYVRVIGDSMEPRYEQGELAAVNAGMLPAKNQDCVVITESGDAHIKRFLGMSDGVVRCLQFNPPKEVEYTDVQAVYAVVRAT